MPSRRHKLNALYKDMGLAVEMEADGRASNRSYRRKGVEKRLRQMLAGVPRHADERGSLSTNSPSSTPGYQGGTIHQPIYPTEQFVDDFRGTGDPYQEALGAVGEMRRQEEGAGGDILLGGPTYTRDIPMHASYMRSAAREMSPFLGKTLTSAALEGAGFANETVDFWRRMRDRALGKEPGGQTGFSESDLIANRVGIMKGLEEADPSYLERAYEWLKRRRPAPSRSGPITTPPDFTGVRG